MSRACGTQWEEDKFLGNFDGKTWNKEVIRKV
jgi:hypothetical protein